MAPTANPNASVSGAPTGCFKCGRPGHWSRDCPSSSSSSVAAGLSSSQQEKRLDSSSWKSSAPSSWKSGKPPLKAAPTKPILPRKRPKLTPDLLLSNDGLGYALEHFPRMVKIQGPGHEVDDLKCFLEAYVHWHSRILPYFSFSQFVEKVAKVGSSRRVRMCVNDLRNRVAKGDTSNFALEEINPERTEAAKDCSVENAGLDGAEPWEDKADDDDDEALPADVNEEVFHEFYKQAMEEETSQPNVHVATPPDMSMSGPAAVSEDAGVSPLPVQTMAGPRSISDDQKLRMEVNRLKALERAKARLAAPPPAATT